MADAGVLYGHRKSKTHPKMRQFIGANRNEIELFKPEAIVESVDRASAFLKTIIDKKGLVLFVGTTPPAKGAIEEIARATGNPYVITRWLGGTLTNFKVMRDRIKRYSDLRRQKEEGALSKYTKKEQVKIGKELDKLARKFDGLLVLERLPDALVIVDAEAHMAAVREANRNRIPVIAIVDNNDNPDCVAWPVIGNDHARLSVQWLLNHLINAAPSGGEQAS